eukprot:g16172.t1
MEMANVMDPEAMCSLDYGLAGLDSLAPPQGSQVPNQGPQQKVGAEGDWPPLSTSTAGGAAAPSGADEAKPSVAAVEVKAGPRGVKAREGGKEGGGGGEAAATAAAATATALPTGSGVGAAGVAPAPAAAAAAAAGGRRARTAAPAQAPAPARAGGGGTRATNKKKHATLPAASISTFAPASPAPPTSSPSSRRDRDRDHQGKVQGQGVRAGKKRKKDDDHGGGDGGGGNREGDGEGGRGGGGKAGGEVDQAEESSKQKANRVRNREHARNTRIRKKEYVESLKVQVGEMLEAKARQEREALLESDKISAERTARRQMVLNMFYLKASEELSRRSWACVLDDGFTCVCPLTPFRSFPPSEAQEDHRLITGIDGMIQDTASLAVFIKSICPRSRNPSGRKLKYQFYTSPEDTAVGANVLMCQWLMKTDNAVECGAQCEVFSHGMLRAYFSPDTRIKRLEIVFDVMSFMQQLQRAVGRGEFRMVPNTVAVAMQPSQQARLVLSADPPYGITYTNEAWTALMGHSAEQAKMFPFTLMNGPAEANNGGALEALVQTCIGSGLKRAEMVELTVVTRDMRRLAVAVQAYPLGTPDGATTHLLLIMEEIPVCAPLPQGGMDLFPFV